MSWRLRLSVETILRLTPAVLGSTVFSIAGLCAAHACLDDQALLAARESIDGTKAQLTAGPRVPPPGTAAAVEFIRKRRGVDKVNLLGWSWGTSIMGMYTTQNNDKVNKLVLYAPQWIRTTASLVQAGSRPGAYRTVSKADTKNRWLTGVPEDKKATLIPAGWYEAWVDATFATDPEAGKHNPPRIRAPNGVVADGLETWSAGKPLYDPGLIRVPTFLAHAEWDADLPSYMLYAYFAKLTNAPYKRYVEIGEGTHTVIMEKNRMQLFHAVQQFLDEELKPGS